MQRLRNLKEILTISLLIFLFSGVLFAQEDIKYQKPPKEILELADFERAPSIRMDTKKEYMLFLYRNTYKTLEELNKEEMRLAGLRIDPRTNVSSRISYMNNIKVRKVRDIKAQPTQVQGLPKNPKIAFISWSPNDKYVAFTNTTSKGLELWLLDVATAKVRKLTDANINANLGNPITWLKDNETILLRMLPKNRKALIDSKKTLPEGPTVTTSDGSISQNRTYQDLLKNKTDEANFETLTHSELYKININGGMSLFKSADMYASESLSPDGKYIMLTTITKPFSYLVTISRFASKTVVYDLQGKEIKVVNELPLREILPNGFMAVHTGKRSMRWRADKPATLYYAQALDGGDPSKKVDFRDQIYIWDAPFTSAPKPLVKTINRYSGIIWGNDNIAILYDYWWNNRNTKTYIFNPSKPQSEPKIVWDRNYQDVYSDPGDFETEENKFGRHVLALEGNNAILIGAGYTPKGQFPFIDKFNIKNFKTKRLYTSKYQHKLERLITIINFKKLEVLVNIQSKNEYPNYYILNLKKKKNNLTQITHFKNPFESIKNVYKKVIKYKRDDGVDLSGTLYLPVGYDTNKKEKLPLLIWAYPKEYKDKNSAGQSTSNPNAFTYPYYGSFVYWVTRGYAVLDDAAFPIVGEGDEEPNDTFLKQLVANAKAAIDAVDDLGYIDRKRVGVGGHSYGAFMTANLLSHSDLFACGVARSGAYNRTLTPFGFQSEQRNYWDVPEVYNTMSPFMNAEKMKTPMLLIHGDADNNPGTHTMQSERYFQALKGLGAPVRLVLLPKESHGYVAKKNIMHLLWEQDQFFEKYLK